MQDCSNSSALTMELLQFCTDLYDCVWKLHIYDVFENYTFMITTVLMAEFKTAVTPVH